MKFTVSKAKPQSFRTDIIAIGCYERPVEEEGGPKRHALIKHADGGIALDKAMGGTLSRQIAAEKFMGERGTTRLLFTAGKIPARFVLLIGLGPREKLDLEVLREAGARMALAAHEYRVSSVALVLERGPAGCHSDTCADSEDAAPARARAIAEGVILGGYRFTRYKSSGVEPDAYATTTFLYEGDANPVRDAVESGRVVAEATLECRDLVNAPGCDATPTILGTRAKKIAASSSLTCSVGGIEAIRKANLSGLLQVSKGSAEPPTFITMHYRPKERARAHVILVGKGVTFDSGGLSLGPTLGMELMKRDMAGAAAVMGVMGVIARIAPPVGVTAYIPATENLPDGSAYKPGDVYTARNGKTVEIITAHAEGRLILADVLSLAAEQKPDAIVDVATLTGAADYCCGELYTLIMGNDQRLVDRVRRAADACGEPIWQLPLVEAYKKGLTSGIADLSNKGKSKAATIIGGLFLREFVGNIPWVHLDIGASSWTDDGMPLNPKGATGAAVRTLVSFVSNFKKSVQA